MQPGAQPQQVGEPAEWHVPGDRGCGSGSGTGRGGGGGEGGGLSEATEWGKTLSPGAQCLPLPLAIVATPVPVLVHYTFS